MQIGLDEMMMLVGKEVIQRYIEQRQHAAEMFAVRKEIDEIKQQIAEKKA
jgi:hypothetical protein